MESILSSRLFTTRRGTIILGVAAAVVAAIVLLVYLNQYRNNVNSGAQPVSVLVAKSLIPKGTPGDVVGTSAEFQVASIPRDQVKQGAFVDPKSLTGRVAAADVFPGQQITAADFVLGNANAITQKLARDQRAVQISLGAPAALGGQLAAGDRVDIWVGVNMATSGGGKPVVRQVMQNVLVLAAGGSGGGGIGGGGGGGGNVTLRVAPAQAGKLIFASQNGSIWLVLRPTTGSSVGPPLQVTAESLLGLAPVQVGGR